MIDDRTICQNKYDKHMKICKHFNETYRNKNSDYGDSFGKVWKSVGIISAYTRLADKFYRFESLVLNPNNGIKIKSENIKDTLLDMANYCIMTAMEIENDEEINARLNTDA